MQGSTWDPDSIMEYEFEPGLIDEPEQVRQQRAIAARDALERRQGVGARSGTRR